MVTPEIRGILKQPFAQQVAALRLRLGNLVPTSRWDDMLGAAHNRAFAVAGAAKQDLLQDLAAAVDRSISEGGTIGDFRRDFRRIVEQKGWSHSGSFNWRSRVIYRTNAATSYAAGRIAQLREGGFPYWMYRHGGSQDPRPQHLAWDGMVLPSDHTFWSTHAPPNGWGCSCRIVGVRNQAMAKRLGGEIVDEPPAGWDVRNPTTGQLPGIDRGWDYQPGADAPSQVQPAAAPARPAATAGTTTTAASLDDFIAAGRDLIEAMPDATESPALFQAALLSRLQRDVGTSKRIAVANKGPGALQTMEASTRFPDSWTDAADRLGPLRAIQRSNTRGWHYTHLGPAGTVRLDDFGKVSVARGDGFMRLDGSLSTTVHELAHRLQAALPDLDAQFQALHARRTAGDPLKSLAALTGIKRYRANERTREDSYLDPYFGKEYDQRGALEMMTMTFELVLGPKHSRLRDLAKRDPELFRLAVGLLFGWRP